MNLVQFAQRAAPLYPVQRFVLKVIGGEELASTGRDIEVTDMFRERTLFKFSEAEYLRYLHENGRASVRELTGRAPLTVLAAGRRTGKSVLHGIVAAHAVHRLMSLDDPQAHYGLLPESRIRITVLSVCKDAAKMVRDNARSVIDSDDMSKRAIESTTGSSIVLRAGKGRVEARFKSARGKGIRGATNFHVGLDEMAFMASGHDLYLAVMPSLFQFDDSSLFVSSTPNYARGFFHKLYKTWSHPETSAGAVALQIPTWELNPTLPTGFLRQQHQFDERLFRSEYGAEFLDDADHDIEE